MKRYQRTFLLFGAPLLILVSGLATAWVLSPDDAVLDRGFLLMYVLGLGSFWGVFFLMNRAS
jgi:FtsH-binding integral membrane protein